MNLTSLSTQAYKSRFTGNTISIGQPSAYCGSPVTSELRSTNDQFQLRFGAKTVLTQPNSIAASRFQNQRVALQGNEMLASLVEKLDEIMTVTGEVYSKNEAFTTLIDVKMPTYASTKYGKMTAAQPVQAKLSSQVEHTLNVGKQANVGIMVMSSEAEANDSRDYLGKARASFSAIDPESVKAGALKPVPVTTLVMNEADTPTNAKAVVWNTQMSNFYKGVATRLGAKDPNAAVPDLANASSSPTRLVNANVYVTPGMLNKKKTGHGGVAVGNALKDMAVLLSESRVPIYLKEVSASYQDKFVETDALQFDTTLDHVDTQTGNMVLSSRIYKLDTKAQTVQGPIILVHALANTNSEAANFGAGGAPLTAFNPSTLDADGLARQNEAKAWLATREAN
jgi:hypothetical protein